MVMVMVMLGGYERVGDVRCVMGRILGVWIITLR